MPKTLLYPPFNSTQPSRHLSLIYRKYTMPFFTLTILSLSLNQNLNKKLYISCIARSTSLRLSILCCLCHYFFPTQLQTKSKGLVRHLSPSHNFPNIYHLFIKNTTIPLFYIQYSRSILNSNFHFSLIARLAPARLGVPYIL